jgi:hypothetical protein
MVTINYQQKFAPLYAIMTGQSGNIDFPVRTPHGDGTMPRRGWFEFGFCKCKDTSWDK